MRRDDETDMWSASRNKVPRRQIIESAFDALSVEQAAIYFEGPSSERVDEALAIIVNGPIDEDANACRVRNALFHPTYDPATRFRACDEALLSWKRSFGWISR